MRRMIKYPSISQFRQIVKEITESACFIGLDGEGKAMFDYLKPKPVVTFTATEKVHGTNASVCYSNSDGVWCQSRENVITVEKDNMGFAWFIEQNKEKVISIIKELAKEKNIDLNTHIISLYGEYAGGNIQKNSALTNSEKCFIIFEHFKVSPIEPQEDSDTGTIEKAKWYKTISYSDFGVPEPHIEWVESPENKIYNIMNFDTWSFTIDFNKPERSQNDLIALVQEIIEPSSPLGKKFGHEANVGEGVVISHLFEDGSLIQAKVKGEAHAKGSSKVKTLKVVDTEKLDKIDKCIEEICHNWRFEQMFDLVKESNNGFFPDMKNISEFIKLVNQDTIKEEFVIISDYGFEPKEVLSKVTKISKLWYIDRLKII